MLATIQSAKGGRGTLPPLTFHPAVSLSPPRLTVHMTRGGSAYARERFTETFGPLNGEVELGNHTLIWIDTPGLLEERALVGDETALAAPDFVPAAGGVMEFLQHFRDGQSIPQPSLPSLHRGYDTG